MRKKRRRGRIPKRSFKIKLKKATIYSIAQITFFSLAGLIIVSFSRQGQILDELNDLLIVYLSWTTIFLPFVLLSFSCLFSKFKIPLNQSNVLVGSLLFFVSVATLSRAGVLGRAAWGGVADLITEVGAFIDIFHSQSIHIY